MCEKPNPCHLELVLLFERDESYGILQSQSQRRRCEGGD